MQRDDTAYLLDILIAANKAIGTKGRRTLVNSECNLKRSLPSFFFRSTSDVHQARPYEGSMVITPAP